MFAFITFIYIFISSFQVQTGLQDQQQNEETCRKKWMKNAALIIVTINEAVITQMMTTLKYAFVAKNVFYVS